MKKKTNDIKDTKFNNIIDYINYNKYTSLIRSILYAGSILEESKTKLEKYQSEYIKPDIVF